MTTGYAKNQKQVTSRLLAAFLRMDTRVFIQLIPMLPDIQGFTITPRGHTLRLIAP